MKPPTTSFLQSRQTTDMLHQHFGIIPAASFSYIGLNMIAPCPSLTGWIQCFWLTDHPGDEKQTVCEKLYPDGGTSLTFMIDENSARADFFHHHHVCAHHWDLSINHISVRFRPGAAKALLGLDLHDFSNTGNLATDLATITFQGQDDLRALLDTLPALPCRDRFQAIQDWLNKLSHQATRPDQKLSSLLSHASTHLLAPQHMADLKGVSRRTLERQLQNHLGHSPNQIHRYAQLRRARQALINTSAPLSTIALDCGYFDQAHFTNAFREQTLETPGQYRERKMSQISNP